MIIDRHGRTFRKLRISLTSECNYACVYCAYGNRPASAPPAPEVQAYDASRRVLFREELIAIVRSLHHHLQLDAVRLTGGEPLLRPGLRYIIAAIRGMGIGNISMTTNGHLLAARARELAEAGLDSVNISLDALAPETFYAMSRHSGLSHVLRAIRNSLDAGLGVKLNTVVVAGKNDAEILPLLAFAMKQGVVIRFLELMPMGPMHGEGQRKGFFSEARMLSTITRHYACEPLPRDPSSTARYWSIDGIRAFGIIANDSGPFCHDCNRLRLDSYGNIYGCLSSMVPVPVHPAMSAGDWKEALEQAIAHKQPVRFAGNYQTMQYIGG